MDCNHITPAHPPPLVGGQDPFLAVWWDVLGVLDPKKLHIPLEECVKTVPEVRGIFQKSFIILTDFSKKF